jgi:hypothetical protein
MQSKNGVCCGEIADAIATKQAGATTFLRSIAGFATDMFGAF